MGRNAKRGRLYDFLGPKGQELVERMEGGYLPDFYGAYLDERIALARKSLRS